jgi:microcin C transport system permease protein
MAVLKGRLARERWLRFRRSRRGFISLWIFLAVFAVSLLSDFVANEAPLVAWYAGRPYFPVFASFPEKTFGGEFETTADFRDPHVQGLIRAKGWMVWPPIPFSYKTINYDLPSPAPSPPTAQNLLGTDENGRDILAILLYGLRISILFGFSLSILSSALGILAGAIQGYYGGRVDILGQRFIEVWSSMPTLFVLIILSNVVQPGFWWLLAINLLFGWMALVGLVRAEFLRARNFEYVIAARALGMTNGRIMFRHILPNAMVASLTFLPFILAGSIFALTTLDYLGFGLPIGSPSLGDLLAQGKGNLQAPWVGLAGFGASAAPLILLVFIGEAVRDAFDPRRAF